MEMSVELRLICLVTFAAELVGEFLLIALSLFVFRAVWRCSVLHVNLKIFLMLKCVSSINQGFVRSYVLISLLGQRPFKPNPPVYASLLVIVSVNINIYLSAAYATERILATIFMRTYEKQRPYYGVGFAALIVCLSVYTACKDTILRSAPSNANATYNLLTFLAAYTNTVISTICLLITVFLRRYNFRRYKNRFLKEKLGKLTERYQNSENVRTTRQLTPVISLHLLASLAADVYITSTVLWPTSDSRFFQRMALHFLNCNIFILCQVALL
ncbi:hypothetical protein AAVH_24876 [Aphelenchoides avenae]|nr:hypothetical protein AAVH_24876 [Aphelenchus avenae]